MYPTKQFQPARIPSQSMMTPSGNLMMILQKQSLTNRITIPEMYIGDEGAAELAAFLRGQPNITMIDVKGNNITPIGFVEIFNALRNNFQLKSLSLEWNRLGTPDISGLEALYNLMSSNRSITHLDLRNNKINSTSAHIIANFIRNNRTLASLDLRWNELGNSGGNVICNAMEENGTIVGIELAGNGISEEIISKIQVLAGNNRDGVPHASMRKQEQKRNSFHGGEFNNSFNERDISGGGRMMNPQTQLGPIVPDSFKHTKGRLLDQSEVQRNMYGGYETLNIISHLEMQIENERVEGLHFKEDLNRRILEFKEALNVKTLRKSQLEDELLARTHENNILRSDFSRIGEELKSFEHQKQKALRQMEDRSNLQEDLIRETDKRLQSELLSLSDQNIFEMRKVESEWNNECEEQTSKVALNTKKTDQIRIEIYQVMDDMVKSEFQSKDEAKELVEKLKDAAQRDYQERFDSLQSRMNEYVEAILANDRRTKENVRDHSERIKQMQEKQNETLIESTRFIVENQDISIRNDEFEFFLRRQTKEHEYKDALIEKLKQELNKLRVKDQQTEQEEKDIKHKIDEDFLKEHDEQNSLHDQHRDRISGLEKTLRDSNVENLRLRADFQKLSDLLSANLQKSTYQTFILHKVM